MDGDLHRVYGLRADEKRFFTVLKRTMYRRIYRTVFETSLPKKSFTVPGYDLTYEYNKDDQIVAIQFWKEGRLDYPEVRQYLKSVDVFIEGLVPHETLIVRNCPEDTLTYLKLRYGNLTLE